MPLTSLDLSILVEEFQELEEGFAQKVYMRDNELTIAVYVSGEGKKRLIISTDYAFISKYKRDNPEKPPHLAMELRKHLGRIDSIEQRGFDRILRIKSGDTELVCEIFGKGNFILTKDGKIINAFREEDWADRTVRMGREYKFPEPAKDPRKMNDYFEALGEGSLVKNIASELSFGGTYAEEVCERAGVEKGTPLEELGEDEKAEVNKAIDSVLEDAADPSPRIYFDGDDPEVVSPFELQTYSDYEYKEFDTFSSAWDESKYIEEQLRERRRRQKAFNEKKGTLERKKEQQERKIQGLRQAAEERRETAELIYREYQTISEIKEQVKQAIDEHGWKETEKRIEEAENEAADRIKSFNEQERSIKLDIDNYTLTIPLDEKLEAVASEYYDKAKESESKIERAEEALEETMEELSELDREEVEVSDVMEDTTEKRSKKWFEKYRWFYSSEGHLVIIGRDAQTNEMAVKKHMQDNDLYFHADFNGAPSVIVKDGQDAGEATREEAAKAAVTFAKTWKAGIGADDIYYVTPDQVTKEAESGEYLSKGGFVIRGERTYMRNVSVEAAIGAYEIEEDYHVPMCGPLSAVEAQCDGKVEVRPGHEKKSEVAKKIRAKLKDQGYSLDLDYIIRSLPPGKSEVK